MAYFKKSLSTRSVAPKSSKLYFFECDWFDPVNGTRVDGFGMVEVKHESRYSDNNILFAHQAQ
jgi:hypothetical protein